MSARFNITFSYQPNSVYVGKLYRCERVIDTVAYKPGEYYTEAEVQELCAKTSWKVTIVAPELNS